MKIIKPAVLFKCKKHKILPETIWWSEDKGSGREYFHVYYCDICDVTHAKDIRRDFRKSVAAVLARLTWNQNQH